MVRIKKSFSLEIPWILGVLCMVVDDADYGMYGYLEATSGRMSIS